MLEINASDTLTPKQQKAQQLTWRRIDYSDMDGWWAAMNGRVAEVVRCYTDSWTYLAYDGGKVCHFTTPTLRYYEAMAQASRFLRGQITHEIWTHLDDRDAGRRKS